MQAWLLTPGAKPIQPKTYPKKHHLRPLSDLPSDVRSSLRSLLYPDGERYQWLTPIERRPRHWNTYLKDRDRLILTQGSKAWRARRVPPGFSGQAWVFRIPSRARPEDEQQCSPTTVEGLETPSQVYTEYQWFKDTRRLTALSPPYDPVFNIYSPSDGAEIALDDHRHASAIYREFTLEADTTFTELADRFFGIEDSNLILNIPGNRDWQIRWMRQRQQPRRGDTLWVPDGYNLRVHGNSSQARRLMLNLQGPTRSERTVILDPEIPPPGHLDPNWQASFRVQPGDYSLSGQLAEQPDRRRHHTFTLLPATPKTLAVLDLCYLPETGQALLITNDLQHWLDTEAAEMDAWLTRLTDAVEQEDTDEVGTAKTALAESLGPTLNRPDTLSGMTEITGYRGRKYTYVRSDKLRNHIRRYNLLVDIRNNRRFTDANGRFDADKAQRSLQEDFGQGPRKLGIRFTSTQFERGMTAWADSWNANQGERTDWLAHSDHYSATTEAAVMRYLAGASLQGGISKTAIGLQAEAQVQASLAEGKATLNTHLPNKAGYFLRMTLPTKQGGQRTLDFGQVRATLSSELFGFAGAKAALAVNLELSMNDGEAVLRGLNDEDVADRQSKDADFKPLDIQFNAFGGASGGCGAMGYLEWDNIEARTDNEPAFRALAEFGGQLEGLTGAGASAAYYIGYENGQFRIRARVGAALGVGLTGELVATVNADTIYDFIQCIYRQLMVFDFGYLGFVESRAFEVLQQVIFGAIATGQRIIDCLVGTEWDIREWWASIRNLASQHDEANDLADRILEDDENILQYAPPETKATLLRCLCLTKGSSMSSSSWSVSGLD